MYMLYSVRYMLYSVMYVHVVLGEVHTVLGEVHTVLGEVHTVLGEVHAVLDEVHTGILHAQLTSLTLFSLDTGRLYSHADTHQIIHVSSLMSYSSSPDQTWISHT